MLFKFLLAACCVWQATAVRRVAVVSKRVQDDNALGRRACVDVNSATIQQLKAVDGIGMSLAYKIVRARTCFLKDVSDLREKLKAQRHSEGLWTFDSVIAPMFETEPPKLCVGCEKNPDKAKSPYRQKVVDVNVASFSRLQRVDGLGESMASRILQARSCFFEDHENFRDRFLARPGNGGLWKFVEDLLKADAICVGDSSSQDQEQVELEDVSELTEQKSEDDEKGLGEEQVVEATVHVQEADALLHGKASPNVEEEVTQAVKKVVLTTIGDEFVENQVECKVKNNAVVVSVTAPFQEQADSVKQELASTQFSDSLTVAGMTAQAEEVIAKPVTEPINPDSLKEEFWKLMGQCGTTRADFDGFEHRPDWDVLPFTSKICHAEGCRDAMLEFSNRHNRPCHETDTVCAEAALWVSVLYKGSLECRGLTMAEKMHEDLAPVSATCKDDFCTTACLQALRDFPGLAIGCRAHGCATAYDQLEAMYDKIAECEKPNAGSTFPLPQEENGLFQVGLGDECVVVSVTGGWVEGAQDFDYCSYFEAKPSDEEHRGKLVDPRTGFCLGWLAKDDQPKVWHIPGVQGPASAPCNKETMSYGEQQEDGYVFHTVWEFQDDESKQICVVRNAAPGGGEVTDFCIDHRTGHNEIVHKADNTQVTEVGTEKQSELDNFPFELPKGKKSLVRLRANNRCVVVPPERGWGLGTTDMDYCTYFEPVGVEDEAEGMYKLKDPRSDFCFGWIHLDGLPSSWTIPGFNGPAAAPCSTWTGDRIGQKIDFNTVFKHDAQAGKLCVVTNSKQLTPYCFSTD